MTDQNPIAKIFSKIAGNATEGILREAGNLFTNKEERMQQENKLREIVSVEIIKQLENERLDIENSRQREIEITKLNGASWFQKNIVALIGGVTILFSFTLFFISTFTNTITPEKKEIFMRTQDYINNMCIVILSYYFVKSHNTKN